MNDTTKKAAGLTAIAAALPGAAAVQPDLLAAGDIFLVVHGVVAGLCAVGIVVRDVMGARNSDDS